MFNPKSEPIMPVQVGDKVKFKEIELDEFISLGGQAHNLRALDLESSEGGKYAN